MKAFKYIAIFLAGALAATSYFVFFHEESTDLLSEQKNQYVKTNKALVVLDEHNNEFVLPPGLILNFKSQYRESGILQLEIVTTDLSQFESSSSGLQYFEKGN